MLYWEASLNFVETYQGKKEHGSSGRGYEDNIKTDLKTLI
jgi:hypothetical protein